VMEHDLIDLFLLKINAAQNKTKKERKVTGKNGERVEYVQIEKYMGGSMIYVTATSTGHHVVCTVLLNGLHHGVFSPETDEV
jgi:archaellum component FlaF (FlaF/FlaG flagellin family)